VAGRCNASQDAQDAWDAGDASLASGRNADGSDAGSVFADVVILVEIQTQLLVTMTTMTTKEVIMAEAEEADVQNAMLEEHPFLEIHLPVREAY